MKPFESDVFKHVSWVSSATLTSPVRVPTLGQQGIGSTNGNVGIISKFGSGITNDFN